MRADDLSALLRTLEGSMAPQGAFIVQPLEWAAGHYFGHDSDGRPCLLIGASTPISRAPIQLAGIEARFGITCDVRLVSGDQFQSNLTVVICTSGDRNAQAYFVHVCATILAILGPSPLATDVVEVVQQLTELFRQLKAPQRKSVTGLIGELTVIQHCVNAATAMRAWRSRDDDRYDFAIETVRLEVKATASRQRVHHISTEQCDPPAGTTALLASLFVESAGGGMSLSELITAIELRLVSDQDAILRLHSTIAETLGETLPQALGFRFDDRLARQSLRFFPLTEIPAIREGIPFGVSQVRFMSDVTNVPAIDPQSLNGRAAELLPAS